MMTPEQRYMRDAQFKTLVDYMEKAIRDLHYTPTEMREAAMLACINYEMRRPARFYSVPEVTP